MWLIVGLGNPGAKYETTRHNLGFLAIDAMLHELGVIQSKASFDGIISRFDVQGQPCISLKPETFMNRSGSSVQQAMAFHKISLDHVVVLHDELDLPLGDIRIKKGGGSSGHNGIKDIARLLGPDFFRIRLGIGRPAIKGIEADFVLSPFSDEELSQVGNLLQNVTRAVKTLILDGLEAAQRQCQTRTEKAA